MIDATVRDPRELVADVERLLAELEALPDPLAREKSTAVVQALLELYGAGLERIVEEVAARDDGTLATALVEDDLVAHLLLLHGLHPLDLEARISSALGEVRPYLESHGGDVEVLEIDGPTLRLRMHGSCSGCPSSTMTLKLAIEEAIHKLAPDVDEIQAEGVSEPAPSPLLKLEISEALGGPGSNASPPAEAWTVAGSLAELSGGGMAVKTVTGEPLLFIKLISDYFAYRPSCPGCGESLGEASLRGTELVCGHCQRKYDVHRAGRCLDEPKLHLEPVPLLLEDSGLVKVALGAAVA